MTTLRVHAPCCGHNAATALVKVDAADAAADDAVVDEAQRALAPEAKAPPPGARAPSVHSASARAYRVPSSHSGPLISSTSAAANTARYSSIEVNVMGMGNEAGGAAVAHVAGGGKHSTGMADKEVVAATAVAKVEDEDEVAGEEAERKETVAACASVGVAPRAMVGALNDGKRGAVAVGANDGASGRCVNSSSGTALTPSTPPAARLRNEICLTDGTTTAGGLESAAIKAADGSF